MTKHYDVINLPDGFIYPVDKEARILKDDWYTNIYGLKPTKSKGGWSESGQPEIYLKIVATNNPELNKQGVPLIEIPNDDIDVIGNCANCGVEYHIHKPSSKKQYSEEDIEAAIAFGVQVSRNMADINDFTEESKEFLKSLKPTIKSVELEVEESKGGQYAQNIIEREKLPVYLVSKLKVVDGKVIVKEVKYE